MTENQIRILANILAEKQGRLQVGSLNISGNKLAEDSVVDLFHKASTAFQSPMELSLGGNRIGADSINSILTIVINHLH